MTSQADLDMRFNNMVHSRKVCSREDIRKLVKKIDSYFMGSYDFYHKDMNREYLERFIDAYNHKELNRIIKFICKKSNLEGGFVDHGVSVIRNRRVEDYIL